MAIRLDDPERACGCLLHAIVFDKGAVPPAVDYEGLRPVLIRIKADVEATDHSFRRES